MFKMLTLLALLLIAVFGILLIVCPEDRLNIPVIKDIDRWISKHKLIGYGCIYGTMFILFIVYIMFN
ncbi:hypothetical protein CPZ25_000030 [Eubacterium maltosivorans]|uniref:Uncharacterized protein n=1 Tax=Eubacterium maltosivorans TaxID=2041044 RepID=A0A4P9C563_EUBML|nr:hypothetical protein CPZ25_000030 [Eubacterium maltosivorans]